MDVSGKFKQKGIGPGFPFIIKKGHATVKIYRRKQCAGWNYAVAYVSASGRVKRTFANLELAVARLAPSSTIWREVIRKP